MGLRFVVVVDVLATVVAVVSMWLEFGFVELVVVAKLASSCL